MTSVNRDNLNDIMEFDHVIRVYEDGTVTEPEGIYAPESVDVATVDEPDAVEGWSLLPGFSMQYSYPGALMHPSEYIGGGLADYILSHPGLYVAVIVNDYEPDSDDVAGWAIAYRED